MPYQASVINVMIASPGDVAAERSAIQAIIHLWNSIHAQERRTVLMPIMWETHATPEMGDRPQAVINRQVLDKCDLLVAVFWTRIGTPTGTSRSGTVEEIREHVAAGKPAMVYFSKTPVDPDSVDANQYQAVKEFREECKKNGLIATYDGLQDFSETFFRHLAQTVRDRFTSNSGSDDDGASVLPVSHPETSEAAKTMLAAASDGGGQILRLRMLSGTVITAGGRQLTTTGEPREVARWEAALQELVERGFVEPLGYKDGVLTITHAGYAYRDTFSHIPY
jgi:hypothetical protein